MKEIILSSGTYSIGRLPAFDQFHISRRLAPLLGALVAVVDQEDVKALKDANDGDIMRTLENPDATSLLEKFQPLCDALATMNDEDAEYIINKCLNVTERKNTGGMTGFAPVRKAGAIMFDLPLPDMLAITFHTIMENMGDFFTDNPLGIFQATARE